MVILVERRRVHRRLLERRRGLYGRVVRAEAARPARRVRVRGGRRQLARRGGCILLAAAQRRQRGEGVGGFVRGRLGEMRLRHGEAPLGGYGLVVEE